MNFNFELILFYATTLCGGIALLDFLFLAPKRKKMHPPLVIDYARAFLPALLIVFVVRSFTYEHYRIPSGSLKPTLLIGDIILVNKYYYGIRLPIIHKKIISIHTPNRGDIVVFQSPTTPSINFIKRVIGVPGDHISYINKILYVNGNKLDQQFEKDITDQDDNLDTIKIIQKNEDLLGVKHNIYQIPSMSPVNFYDVVVPEGKYFMMGDNRDNSADSRSWGFLADDNIIGKATRVLVSWDKIAHPFRWERMGMKIT